MVHTESNLKAIVCLSENMQTQKWINSYTVNVERKQMAVHRKSFKKEYQVCRLSSTKEVWQFKNWKKASVWPTQSNQEQNEVGQARTNVGS